MNWRKGCYLLALVALLFGLLPAVAGAQTDWSKVDPALRERLAREGTAEFHIVMKVQADVSGAAALKTKVEKTTYVYNLLRQTAEVTQRPILNELAARGIPARSFYVYNAIAATGGLDTVAWLAARADVARIVSAPDARPDPVYKDMTTQERIATIEWNVARVHAPDVWALGFRGEGMVVAGNDTGVDYTHPALVRQYRGCLNPPTCSTFDHNYNWWGGPGSSYPVDNDGHGTHTMGTMVGEDAGQTNQIGVAPGARWIACAGLGGSDTVECFNFLLAPWNLQGQNPDPTKAPDAINNSWYDPSGYDYRPIIQNLNAAGIAVIKSAGNQGPGCSTITNPGYVPEIIATAAFAQGDTIASFSSRGPSSNYGPTILKPEVAAPGVNIRSSVPGGGYEGGWSGTSMAAPHSTALVALIWSAATCLRGDVPTTKQIMMETAEAKIDAQCPPFVDHPNDVWGWGILDDLLAVQTAMGYCGGMGALDGHVTDAATSLPIAGAVVRAVGEGGFSRSDSTDSSGYYTMTLFHGTYTVTASAFGYIPQMVTSVDIVTDTVTTQDFALQPAPTYIVSGTVTEAGSGAPLFATVQVLGTPIPPVQTTPATGYYSITVPEGTYTFRASALLHRKVDRVVVVDHDQTQDFSLPTLACVLLVDDDQNSPDVRSYYTAALDNLGYSYDIYDLSSQGDPSASDLAGYRAVIWFTGYPWGNTFNATNESAVAAYLDSGGNFFLSSEDYLYDFGLTPFGQNYLGITSYSDDKSETDVVGNAGNPIGDGLGPYYLTPPSGWSGQLWTDYASGPNSPFRFQGSGQNNSVNKSGGTYNTVFFAWPLEGIASLTDRATVLDRIITYFGGCGAMGLLTGQVTHDYYGTPIAEATVTAQPAQEGAAIQATTDPNGHYTLTLSPGTYDVTASKDGYTTVVIEDVAVGQGVTVLDIQLSSPVIVVSPESLHAFVAPSGTVTLTLNVANPGDLDLSFAIAETTATLRLAGWRPAAPATVYVPEAVADVDGVSTLLDPVLPRPTWTCPDTCGGQDASRLQNSSLGMNTLGFGHQFLLGYRMAGDFTIEGNAVVPIDVPWVSEAPTASVVPAGSALNVAVIFTALPPFNVAGESYTATLVFSHNDPEQGEVRISVTMTVVTCWPPVEDPDFDWTPPQPYLGEEVSFSAWVGGGAEPISYTWDFGDGEIGTGQTATHIYAAAGPYTVTLTATNCDGQYQAQVSHVIEVLCPPVAQADFSWSPLSPLPGEVVTFQGTATSTVTPLTFTWDFGDGTFGVGASVTHTYDSAGLYTVTMTATNACGAHTQATYTLTVLPCDEVAIVTVTQSAAGCVVTFDAVLSGTAPFAYLWDFGALGTYTDVAPVVDFQATGIYTGTLQVWNCVNGYDSMALTVVVSCAPPRYTIFLPIIFARYP